MDWATTQEAIRQAVITATGIPDADVVWYGTSEGWRSFPRVDLITRIPEGVGVDEDRMDSEGEHTICGTRRFTLSVRIEADTGAPGAESVAHLAGRLRTRLRRAAVLALLQAAGVATERVDRTQEFERETAEGRRVSLSVTDVLLSVAENDTDDSNTDEWIESVDLTSDTLDDPDGDPHDPQVGPLTIPEE